MKQPLISFHILQFILTALSVLRVFSNTPGGSPIEDILETQIDYRHPRSFHSFDLLSVRQTGFKTFKVWNKAAQSYEELSAGNWEKWAAG